MRNRHYYKSQNRYDRVKGFKPSHGKLVIDDPQFIVDLIGQVRKLDEQVRQWGLEDGINWIIGLDSYIKDKINTLNPRFGSAHRFIKGDIVLVDFFGHFGNELTYEHPAIILADNFKGLIIAPISSTSYNDGIDTHVNLIKDLPGYGSVKNNSGIKLEQIRYISKSRILQKFKRVSDNAKLKEIDEVIMNLVAGFTYNSLLAEKQKLENEIVLAAAEIIKLSEEVNEKNEEIMMLQKSSIINQELLAKDEEISLLNEQIQELLGAK
ncbi:MAG: type II toxin-antitoxin system PemK/MazF family toxin [Bacilli bacterium]|nr:type II toxin-antitoxin system PemK/MazF family toxin [Bacilli bacterium]